MNWTQGAWASVTGAGGGILGFGLGKHFPLLTLLGGLIIFPGLTALRRSERA